MVRNQCAVLNLVLGFLVFFINQMAWAYPTPVDFDGSLMRWDILADSDAITYEILTDNDDDLLHFGPFVDESAALWSRIPGSFLELMPVEEGQKAQISIHLRSAIDGGDYSAGYALFDEYNKSKPLHCSIYVALSNDQSFHSIAKTILHELGHCLGLGHSLIPQAIMSYRLESNDFALDVDDEAAITRLYPSDGSKPRLPPGCAVGAMHSGARGWFTWLLLFMLPLGPGLALRSPFAKTTKRGRISSSLTFDQ